MQKLLSKLFLFSAVLMSTQMQAQYGPRLFLDAPGIFFTAPDAAKAGNNLGLGTDISMNIATHAALIRIGGGSLFTLNPKGDDVIKTFLTTPFVKLEAGAGRYRSNGNKCAKSHRPAYSALVKGGVRYNFLTPKNRPDGTAKTDLDYTVGVELGYFYIRDIIRNTEVFGSGNYNIKAKNVSAEIGMRTFFNLRGRRD